MLLVQIKLIGTALLGKTGVLFLFIPETFGPFERILIALFSEISCVISKIYYILHKSDEWPSEKRVLRPETWTKKVIVSSPASLACALIDSGAFWPVVPTVCIGYSLPWSNYLWRLCAIQDYKMQNWAILAWKLLHFGGTVGGHNDISDHQTFISLTSKVNLGLWLSVYLKCTLCTFWTFWQNCV